MGAWAFVATIVGHRLRDNGFVVRCTTGSFLFQEGMEVHLVPPAIDVPRVLHVERVEELGKSEWLLHFAEEVSAEQASSCIGMRLLVPGEVLPEEVRVHVPGSLAGFAIVDEEGAEIGIVSEVLEYPGQDLIALEGERGVLIPFVDAYVQAIDEEARQIVVTLPAGFLEVFDS